MGQSGFNVLGFALKRKPARPQFPSPARRGSDVFPLFPPPESLPSLLCLRLCLRAVASPGLHRAAVFRPTQRLGDALTLAESDARIPALSFPRKPTPMFVSEALKRAGSVDPRGVNTRWAQHVEIKTVEMRASLRFFFVFFKALMKHHNKELRAIIW